VASGLLTDRSAELGFHVSIENARNLGSVHR